VPSPDYLIFSISSFFFFLRVFSRHERKGQVGVGKKGEREREAHRENGRTLQSTLFLFWFTS
jgi:hypothetical protein